MAGRKYKDPFDVRGCYPGEQGRSPYWEWVSRHCPVDDTGAPVEPRGANPSRFAEAGEEDRSDELKAILEVLNDGGLDKLSIRQRRAFKLVIIGGLTYKEAGRRMGISAMTAHGHVRSAARKLLALCGDKV